MTRQRVLVLCEAHSAGTEKTSVNPLAIRAMAERGVDINGHTSRVYEARLAAWLAER